MARLLCPWDFPGKNTGVGGHVLLQGIFPCQGSSPLLPWQVGSLPLLVFSMCHPCSRDNNAYLVSAVRGLRLMWVEAAQVWWFLFKAVISQMQLRPLVSTELLTLQSLTEGLNFAERPWLQGWSVKVPGFQPRVPGSCPPPCCSAFSLGAACLIPWMLGAELQRVRAGFHVSSRRFLQDPPSLWLDPGAWG